MTSTSTRKKKPAVKAIILIAFILTGILIVRLPSVQSYLTPAGLGRVIERAGVWAPLIYIIVYLTGVCLFVPGTVLTGLGAVIFDPWWGFCYVWIGAMLGASAAFFIGRFLGRDFAASLIGDRLRKYDDAIEKNGFAAVLYLRLIYFPFTPMNFGMGITKVRFRDYFFGTGLGILVGTFVLLYFFGTLKTVWVSGDYGALMSPNVFFSLGLFIFSFFIPRIIKRFKGEND